MNKLIQTAAITLAFAATAASAQAVRIEKNMSLELATQIAAATVGVGGAPDGHLDEQCAMAGIAKVQDQLK